MRNGTNSIDLGGCGPSHSFSSQHNEADDRMIAVVLSEEYAKSDGAVARHRSNLLAVPVKIICCLYLHFLFLNIDPTQLASAWNKFYLMQWCNNN